MNPEPTPVPIHDIAAPISFFPYPVWMIVAAGAGVVLILAALLWLVFFRRRSVRTQAPRERALAALAALRGEVAETDPYAFSIRVSDVLRAYLRDERGLLATTQTSIEFLESVRSQNTFSDQERVALTAFLEKADLIKFARLHAGEADCQALVDRASRLVEGAGTSEAARA